MERRLAAILAADVVGYSRLIREDEAGTLAALKAHREQLIAPKVAEHKGRIVKLMGDGLLVEFPSAVEAVQCAVEIQHMIGDRNATVSEEKRITYRIGINIGDIVVEDDDIYGDGVNVAARLEGLAEPSGICVARNVFNQVKDKLDLTIEHLGEREVKNIAEPVTVYRVVLDDKAAALVTPVVQEATKSADRPWVVPAAVAVVLVAAVGGVFWWQPWAPDVEPASLDRMAFPLPEKPSIAVLPFDNLSGDPKQEFLADGITESIITQLSKLDELFVTARNSTFTYKGKPVKVQQVAEELGVRYVLEGSVQRSGENLRISAQLIDALSGNHVWAERYDQELREIFALQDTITLNVLTALQVTLTAGEIARLNRRQTDSLEAYLQYYQGVTHYLRFTAEDNERARRFFERAAELDPGFVRPWVNQAWTHQLAARLGWSPSRAESYERAAQIAQKALSLDDTNPGVHALLGAVYRSQRKFDEAIAAGRKAITLAPNVSENHALLAVTLYYAGEFEETIALTKKAMRLHPHYPDWYLYRIGTAYRMLGRYDEAVAALKEFFDRNPTRNLLSITALAATYSMMGRMEEAGALVAQALELDPNASLERVAKMHYFRDPAHLQGILNALRKAGLPEKPPLPLPEKPSIAVLPFDNMSADPEQEYFADGMTEDLITDLAKVSGLLVIARNSTFAYKGQSPDVREVAQQLGVRYVVEGSVRKVGGRIRINAQLIDAETGTHLWAERYDREATDVFGLQDEVRARIVTALRVKLTPAEVTRLAHQMTDNAEAYDYYIRGLQQESFFTKEGNLESLRLFERAIELDPAFATAYGRLATAHTLAAENGWSLAPEESMETARLLAGKAIALDADLPQAHWAVARVYSRRQLFDGDRAIASLQKAIALDPNYADAYAMLANVLMRVGRAEEALGHVERAMRLNPRFPFWYYYVLGASQFMLTRYDAAVENFQKAIERNQTVPWPHRMLIASYGHLGQTDDAEWEIEELAALGHELTLDSARKTLNIAHPASLQRYLDGLREAGVPEE